MKSQMSKRIKVVKKIVRVKNKTKKPQFNIDGSGKKVKEPIMSRGKSQMNIKQPLSRDFSND